MPAERVIIIDPVAQAREQFSAEMRELEKNPLDRAKKSGGYYLNANGSGAHDAEGRPVELLAGDKKQAAEAQRREAARNEGTESELVPLDSPEEVRDRGLFASGAAGYAGLPGGALSFTPAAVPEGQVLPDGTTSQPDPNKAGRSSRKSATRAKARRKSGKRKSSSRRGRSASTASETESAE